jgi:hypothetical protein
MARRILISGVVVMGFVPEQGASAASGMIEGFDSFGQVIDVTPPGWADKPPRGKK